MNREFVDNWLVALRSGKYAQCRDGGFSTHEYNEDMQRCNYTSFCCLGLANHIDGVEPHEVSNLNKNVPELDTIIIDGLQAREDRGVPDSQRSLWAHLTAANDGSGIYKGKPYTFEQLADLIEEKLNVL